MHNYNAVILGARGSGKTVYLSSLYHKLSTPGGRGYFLSAPLLQEKRLTRSYASLLKSWLPATALAQTDIFDFDVTVKSPSGENHKALTIRYHDISGGRQTEESGDAGFEEETEAIFNGADIMLGFIDGERLLRQINGDDSDETFWVVDMQALCAQMTKHESSDKSIYFIVTKWDHYEDSDESLEEAASALLEYPAFQDVISNCAATARLIPVSSVGRNYAAFLNGASKSRNGSLPCPQHVELPFACILPDIIDKEFKSAQRLAEQRAKELNKEIDPDLNWWEAFGGWVGNKMSEFFETRGLDGGVFRTAAEFARRSANAKIEHAAHLEEQNRAEAARLHKAVINEATAIEFVMQSMMITASEFDSRYPSSKLNGS